MLETTADRLSARGAGRTGPRPTRMPARRLDDDRGRGRAADPVHERDPDRDRRDARGAARGAARAPRRSHERHGHVQEVIVQNFRAKPGTRMAAHPEPSLDDHLWTIAVGAARARPEVARAGAAEPRLRRLPAPARRGHRRLGRRLAGDDRPRQPGGAVARGRAARARRPGRAASSSRRACRSTREYRRTREWLDPRVLGRRARARRLARARPRGRLGAGRRRARVPFVVRRDALPVDTRGRARRGRDRAPAPRARARSGSACSPPPTRCAARSTATTSRYVVTRNVQYTNVCYFRCGFCAFSKGKLAANLRGAAVPRAARRDRAPRARGVGARRDRGLPAGRDPSGLHRRLLPRRSCAAIKEAVPELHVHAFSRARGLAGRGDARRCRSSDYLARLRDAGPRLAPGHGGRDPRRRGARASSAPTRSRPRSGSRCTTRRTRRPALERRRSCSATSTGRAAGRGTCSRVARPAAAHGRLHRVRAAAVRAHGGADLPARAGRAAARRSARRCSCTRSRGSRCIRGSRTSRPRG